MMMMARTEDNDNVLVSCHLSARVEEMGGCWWWPIIVSGRVVVREVEVYRDKRIGVELTMMGNDGEV